MKFSIFFKSLPIAAIALFTTFTMNAQAKQDKTAGTEVSEADEIKADKEMAKELKLNKTQKAKFKKADDDYRAKSKAIKNARKEELQRLREERMRAHKAALSPEQLKKYDEAVARKEAKLQEKMARKAEKNAGKEARKAEKKVDKSTKKAGKEKSGQ